MDINSIKAKYDNLSKDLKQAVSRMEKTDKVFVIRDAIRDLQILCPHDNGSFDFSTTEYCPYCGKKFGK
jgi:hypothetical protein